MEQIRPGFAVSELALEELRSHVARLVYQHGFVAPRLFHPSSPQSFFGLVVESGATHCLVEIGDLEAAITDLVHGPVEVLSWSGVRVDRRDSLLLASEPL